MIIGSQPRNHFAASKPTAREMEVLKLICDGYSMNQIAALLKITSNTVRANRSRLFKKAGAATAVGLFRWALRNRFIWIDELRSELVGWPRKDTPVREVLDFLRADNQMQRRPCLDA